MNWYNHDNSYGLVAKVFHWLVSVMIITMLFAGFYMTNIAELKQKYFIYGMHKASGVIILALISLRLLWKLYNVKVTLPSDTPKWQKILANSSHSLLYLLPFMMTLSGIFASLYGGHNINMGIFSITAFQPNLAISKLLNDLHHIVSFILPALISLHILTALYHHFIKKDRILLRMLKG